jgi:hypothetical protein
MQIRALRTSRWKVSLIDRPMQRALLTDKQLRRERPLLSTIIVLANDKRERLVDDTYLHVTHACIMRVLTAQRQRSLFPAPNISGLIAQFNQIR